MTNNVLQYPVQGKPANYKMKGRWIADPEFKDRITPVDIGLIFRCYSIMPEFNRIPTGNELSEFDPYGNERVMGESWTLRFDRAMTTKEIRSGKLEVRNRNLVAKLEAAGLIVECKPAMFCEWVFVIHCGDEDLQQYLCRSLFKMGVTMRRPELNR